MTERLDLTASRNETWRPTIDIPYTGGSLPLLGATIAMQWRLYEGAPGASLIGLPAVPYADFPANEEDIAAGVAGPGYRILRLSPVVNQAVLESLPTGLNQPEPGEADRYVYDVIITYSDGSTDRPIEGFVYLNKGTIRA
ncbi:hypothetical protein [Sphingobium sp.]|uniref:hypothetical protein n=1 Tax=Sphingobium sp. TaxID=1912891 RepID=UPI00257AD7B0|nr:hypothetical protein [Sphingobium sp.]MBR2268334.1 hypothetical protein [Sphingobium sp.]